MKILSVILAVLMFGFTGLSFADEIHLTWDANVESNVQCYRIYMGTQVDMTTWTWEQVGEVAAPAVNFIYDLPDNTLRLFRVSACNQSEETIRYDTGVFACFSWTPPFKPCGTGAF